jgi:hypothetical protein
MSVPFAGLAINGPADFGLLAVATGGKGETIRICQSLPPAASIQNLGYPRLRVRGVVSAQGGSCRTGFRGQSELVTTLWYRGERLQEANVP